MAKVYSIDGLTPVVHPDAYVHPTAVLIGDVHIGAGVYIGPCASLRGDFGRLVIEAGANIQDCCNVHGFPESDTVIAHDGHNRHGPNIHSARVVRRAQARLNAGANGNRVAREPPVRPALPPGGGPAPPSPKRPPAGPSA